MAFTTQCGHRHDTVAEARGCRFNQYEGAGAAETTAIIDGTVLVHKPVVATARPEKPGIYLSGGTYYKVQESRESGRLYAKEGRNVQKYGVGADIVEYEWAWVYSRGAIYNLKASDLLAHEQAAEFGKLWNVCVNCFKDLTREESMERGYGPTCADNLGWPYDHNRKG